MNLKINTKYIHLFIHIFIWVFFFLYPFFFHYVSFSDGKAILRSFLQTGSLATLFYINFFVFFGVLFDSCCQTLPDPQARTILGICSLVLAGVTLDFAGMYSRAVIFDIANTQVKVAAIDDLIAMKSVVGHEIDLMDIEHLNTIKHL